MSAAPERSKIIRLLLEHRVTPTQQRVEIALVLLTRPQHLSADEILAQVNAHRRTHVSKATVYNTLRLFAEKRLVREVIADPSKVFYDSNTRGHHHFYNIETGELLDIPDGQLALARMPELPAGMCAEGVDVIVRVRRGPCAAEDGGQRQERSPELEIN